MAAWFIQSMGASVESDVGEEESEEDQQGAEGHQDHDLEQGPLVLQVHEEIEHQARLEGGQGQKTPDRVGLADVAHPDQTAGEDQQGHPYLYEDRIARVFGVGFGGVLDGYAHGDSISPCRSEGINHCARC